MADVSPPLTSPRTKCSPESHQSSSESSSPNAEGKIGRPSKWTVSRQRKLARLYLYTILPTKDIREALKENDAEWAPGQVSTTKTVNSLLDNDPRWLRPKTREEMDKRILGLSARRAHRKLGRKPSRKPSCASDIVNYPSSHFDVDDFELFSGPPVTSGSSIDPIQAPNNVLFIEFSETPIEDLFALAPQLPYGSDFNPSAAPPRPVCDELGVFSDDVAADEDLLLASMLWPMPPEFEHPFTTSIRTTTQLSAADGESLSTELSTSSLKRRLSKYSTLYLKAIAQLLKAHSVSDTSPSITTSTGPTYHGSLTVDGESTTGVHTIRPTSSVITTLPRSRISRVTLPSALLMLDRHIQRQGICLPGFKTHDSGTCWCLEELQGQIWVDKNGLVKPPVVSDPPRYWDLGHLDLNFQDAFGNSVLHMLAARGAEIDVIVEALAQGADGNAKNTAGQNFLHLLPRRLLRTLAEDRNDLMWVLQKFNNFNVRFHDCDIFGRSFFHLLSRQARDISPNSLEALAFLNIRLTPTRDSFGWVACIDSDSSPGPPAVDNTSRTHTRVGWSRISRVAYNGPTDGSNNIPPVIYEEIEDGTMHRVPMIPSNNTLVVNDSLMYKHSRLLETACIAIDVPSIQDSQGRNGLQCLAEASLCLHIILYDRASGSSNKRKRSQSDPKASPTRLKFRYELAQKMVHMSVDLNNYDNQGSTVLMAFVTYLPDGEDDKTLADIFTLLINSGADVHRRNRQGESPLHIAVRLGRKVATRVLLIKGANVHARTAEGKGVLAVGEAHYFKARNDPPLYASIMGCMALCIKCRATATPTLVQEWSVKDGDFV